MCRQGQRKGEDRMEQDRPRVRMGEQKMERWWGLAEGGRHENAETKEGVDEGKRDDEEEERDKSQGGRELHIDSDPDYPGKFPRPICCEISASRYAQLWNELLVSP